MNKKPVPKINTNIITVVEWKDAQCDADWGEIEPPELAKVVTAGFLISESSAINYAKALETLFLNKSLRKKMGNYNCQYIINNLLLDKMVSRYEDFFKKIC